MSGRIAVFAGLLVLAAQQPAPPPDTIFVNAHVVTVDERFSIFLTLNTSF